MIQDKNQRRSLSACGFWNVFLDGFPVRSAIYSSHPVAPQPISQHSP